MATCILNLASSNWSHFRNLNDDDGLFQISWRWVVFLSLNGRLLQLAQNTATGLYKGIALETEQLVGVRCQAGWRSYPCISTEVFGSRTYRCYSTCSIIIPVKAMFCLNNTSGASWRSLPLRDRNTTHVQDIWKSPSSSLRFVAKLRIQVATLKTELRRAVLPCIDLFTTWVHDVRCGVIFYVAYITSQFCLSLYNKLLLVLLSVVSWCCQFKS